MNDQNDRARELDQLIRDLGMLVAKYWLDQEHPARALSEGKLADLDNGETGGSRRKRATKNGKGKRRDT